MSISGPSDHRVRGGQTGYRVNSENTCWYLIRDSSFSEYPTLGRNTWKYLAIFNTVSGVFKILDPGRKYLMQADTCSGCKRTLVDTCWVWDTIRHVIPRCGNSLIFQWKDLHFCCFVSNTKTWHPTRRQAAEVFFKFLKEMQRKRNFRNTKKTKGKKKKTKLVQVKTINEELLFLVKLFQPLSLCSVKVQH